MTSIPTYIQHTDKNHDKKTGIYPKLSQNENISVKMGELFAHFDKNIIILRKSIFVSAHSILRFKIQHTHMKSQGQPYPGVYRNYILGILGD